MSFGDFIKRDGSRLVYGPCEHGGLAGKTFRFMGLNIHQIYSIYSGGVSSLLDEGEVDDVVETLGQMGATALRFYCISYRKPDDPENAMRFFDGPGKPNEAVLDWFERLLEKCAAKGVRVILPLTCQYGYQGGIPEQVAWRYPKLYMDLGWPPAPQWADFIDEKVNPLFFNDSGIRDDFKAGLEVLLERFRDNRAILCWETGCEIRNGQGSTEWTDDITAFIRARDPNHLIMEGRWGDDRGVGYVGMLMNSLDRPHIDIVQPRFYAWIIPRERWAEALERDLADAHGRKAYIIGEFGLDGSSSMADLMRRFVHSEASGALLWALAPHGRTGGYLGDLYRYPGFTTEVERNAQTDKERPWEGSVRYEAELLGCLRECAFEMRGLSIPSKPVPKPPVLLPIEDSAAISWRGSTGAESYDVYRAAGAEGPWVKIGADVHDNFIPSTPGRACCFSDKAPLPTAAYYRVTAKNVSGVSGFSDTVLASCDHGQN